MRICHGRTVSSNATTASDQLQAIDGNESRREISGVEGPEFAQGGKLIRRAVRDAAKRLRQPKKRANDLLDLPTSPSARVALQRKAEARRMFGRIRRHSLEKSKDAASLFANLNSAQGIREMVRDHNSPRSGSLYPITDLYNALAAIADISHNNMGFLVRFKDSPALRDTLLNQLARLEHARNLGTDYERLQAIEILTRDTPLGQIWELNDPSKADGAEEADVRQVGDRLDEAFDDALFLLFNTGEEHLEHRHRRWKLHRVAQLLKQLSKGSKTGLPSSPNELNASARVCAWILPERLPDNEPSENVVRYAQLVAAVSVHAEFLRPMLLKPEAKESLTAEMGADKADDALRVLGGKVREYSSLTERAQDYPRSLRSTGRYHDAREFEFEYEWTRERLRDMVESNEVSLSEVVRIPG